VTSVDFLPRRDHRGPPRHGMSGLNHSYCLSGEPVTTAPRNVRVGKAQSWARTTTASGFELVPLEGPPCGVGEGGLIPAARPTRLPRLWFSLYIYIHIHSRSQAPS
jgi:hypothetical protein